MAKYSHLGEDISHDLSVSVFNNVRQLNGYKVTALQNKNMKFEDQIIQLPEAMISHGKSSISFDNFLAD